MPSWEDSGTSGDTAYHRLLTQAFKSQMEVAEHLPAGSLAVVYDKNPMEASGAYTCLRRMIKLFVMLCATGSVIA